MIIFHVWTPLFLRSPHVFEPFLHKQVLRLCSNCTRLFGLMHTYVLTIAVVAAFFLAHSSDAFVYVHSKDAAITFDTTTHCKHDHPESKLAACISGEGVLLTLQTSDLDAALGGGFEPGEVQHIICGMQRDMCMVR